MSSERPVELLAPAGSWESMAAAVSAGADAVYMGGKKYGARAYAENPDDETLLAAIDYVHLRGKRLYLTVNTLLKERELQEDLENWLTPFYRQGLDAVIVQDLGAFSRIRAQFPDLPLHVSTQSGVSSPWGARLMETMGAKRLILPRELSLSEIRAIGEAADLEIEIFIHGSLCYCYSGLCLMSSLIGGRSGNRGRCAQPCRLPYNGKYLFNMKDLCTLRVLPDILDAKVTALKIEGRMKSPRYCAGVVRVYRKYLDRLLTEGAEAYDVEGEDVDFLQGLFDRGGFTEGYIRPQKSGSMLCTQGKPKSRRVDERGLAQREEEILSDSGSDSGYAGEQIGVEGRVWLIPGEPARIELRRGNTVIRKAGPAVETARTQPLSRREVEERLRKTGESPFRMERLEVIMAENAFLPVGALNRLRREALRELEEEICRGYRRIH